MSFSPTHLRRFWMICLPILTLTLTLTWVIIAEAGSSEYLDTTFGGTGIVTTTIDE